MFHIKSFVFHPHSGCPYVFFAGEGWIAGLVLVRGFVDLDLTDLSVRPGYEADWVWKVVQESFPG